MLYLLRYGRIGFQLSSYAKVFHRTYMKVSPKMELLLKRADHIPHNYELIYRETGYKVASIMYHTINFITCASLGTLSYFWYIGADLNLHDDSETIKFVDSPFMCFIFGFAVVSTLSLAAVTRSRYALRVYYSELKQKYKVIFIGKVPFTREYYEFSKGTATYVAKNSRLPWYAGLVNCNGRKIVLQQDNFKTPSCFHEMLQPSEL